MAAAELTNFPGDPVDRFRYATARSLPAVLLSKDRLVRQYSEARRDVAVVW